MIRRIFTLLEFVASVLATIINISAEQPAIIAGTNESAFEEI